MRGDAGFLHSAPMIAERQPPVRLPTKNLLHVFHDSDDDTWNVWLNTEEHEFDGLCVAVADSRAAACRDAVAVFQAAIEELQKPVPTDGAQ